MHSHLKVLPQITQIIITEIIHDIGFNRIKVVLIYAIAGCFFLIAKVLMLYKDPESWVNELQNRTIASDLITFVAVVSKIKK